MGKKAGAIAGGVAAIGGVVTGAVAANKAKKEAARQEEIAQQQQDALAALEAERPTMTNPYDNMQNEFEDLNNPYANLTVATEAFKMQAEQADQALANSLDAMMETGQAAGGATALAQAALESKRGIAASINAQEAQNNKMRAEGQASVEKAKAQGAQRLQELMGQADLTVQKDAIRFKEMQMDRAATLADNAMQNAADARGSRIKAISGMGDSMMQAAGNFAQL
jgi:chromosome segregation ATPase